MQWPTWLSVLCEVLVKLLGIFNCCVEECFEQTIDLGSRQLHVCGLAFDRGQDQLMSDSRPMTERSRHIFRSPVA